MAACAVPSTEQCRCIQDHQATEAREEGVRSFEQCKHAQIAELDSITQRGRLITLSLESEAVCAFHPALGRIFRSSSRAM